MPAARSTKVPGDHPAEFALLAMKLDPLAVVRGTGLDSCERTVT